jgi:hypothetical protein
MGENLMPKNLQEPEFSYRASQPQAKKLESVESGMWGRLSNAAYDLIKAEKEWGNDPKKMEAVFQILTESDTKRYHTVLWNTQSETSKKFVEESDDDTLDLVRVNALVEYLKNKEYLAR